MKKKGLFFERGLTIVKGRGRILAISRIVDRGAVLMRTVGQGRQPSPGEGVPPKAGFSAWRGLNLGRRRISCGLSRTSGALSEGPWGPPGDVRLCHGRLTCLWLFCLRGGARPRRENHVEGKEMRTRRSWPVLPDHHGDDGAGPGDHQLCRAGGRPHRGIGHQDDRVSRLRPYGRVFRMPGH